MVFSGCKSQIFFIGDQNAGRGDRMTEARRCSERQGDCFAGPGGHSANLEARRSFLRGSWHLCTPSPTQQILSFHDEWHKISKLKRITTPDWDPIRSMGAQEPRAYIQGGGTRGYCPYQTRKSVYRNKFRGGRNQVCLLYTSPSPRDQA